MKPAQFIIALVATALFTSGCNRPFATATKAFENACWPMTDTIEVNFENADTSQVYVLWFPLEVEAEDYAYNNIHLRASVTPPSGKPVLIPARFGLVDPTGEWMSEDVGERVGFQLLLSSGLRFNQVGPYKVRLYHFMQDSSLCGVTSAGITIEKAAPEGQ